MNPFEADRVFMLTDKLFPMWINRMYGEVCAGCHGNICWEKFGEMTGNGYFC